jgi:miniconductance mechanosensitive channel
MDYVKDILVGYGIESGYALYLAYAIIAVIILIVCFLADVILRKVIIKIISGIDRKNKVIWDDILLKHRVIQRAVHMLPGFIVYISAPMFGRAGEIIARLSTVYILTFGMLAANSLLDYINDLYVTRPISKVRPIKGLLQVIRIVMIIVVAIIAIASLMGKSPLILLSGIGAAAALFSFVFKDSILGFIAGIQLTANDMLRIGDWIDMPKYGADGNVIDITLNTVKVQNFDKSIVTIPAYVLVSDSFRNWRGMMEFGGRRIKRAIHIDVNSIRFVSDEMRSTNLGAFREYVMQYLRTHPGIEKNAAIMVRQLSLENSGLPLEIYAFTTTTVWETYENVQSDIFEHIISVANEFGLRIFQNPTGHDVRQISRAFSENQGE